MNFFERFGRRIAGFGMGLIAVLAVLASSQGWSISRPHDDALHSPVMKPTEDATAATATATLTPLPDFEASPIPLLSARGIRAIAGPIECDVNGDATCDINDFIALSDAIKATGVALTPAPTPSVIPASATPRPASPTPVSTSLPRATATTQPTARASATPLPTIRPSAIPSTSTPVRPTPTLVAQPTTEPEAGNITPFYFGDTMEKFTQTFELVKAAAARNPNMPACDESDPAIHPKTKWHSLVHFTVQAGVIVADCHYSHQHGIDPNAGNSIFGLPGAWLGVPGQSLSGPQETFAIPSSINDPGITPAKLAAMGLPVVMENDPVLGKHTGNKWFVSTGSECTATDPNGEFYRRMCVTAFRVQFHQHSLLDFHVRFHSFTLEAQVCAWVDDQQTCGIRRLAGWGEHSRLFTPPENVRCWAEFQKEPPPGLVDLPTDNQFYESPYTEDTPPRDEFRCHWVLSPATVINNLNGLKAVPEHMPSEWWTHIGIARVQAMIPNPISGPDSRGVALKPYCQMVADTNPHLANMCRWSGQKLFVNTGYILPVNAFGTFYSGAAGNVDASDDTDGDGILDAKRYTTRFGQIRQPGACRAISLDCLPDTWEGQMLTPHPLRRNANGTPYINAAGKRESQATGYFQGVKDLRAGNSDGSVNIFDGDITPAGTKTWIAEAWVIPSREIGPVAPDIQELYEHAGH